MSFNNLIPVGVSLKFLSGKGDNTFTVISLDNFSLDFIAGLE